MAVNTDTTVSQPPLAQHDSRLLDLAFAMDTTSSMSSYIQAACDSVRRIVEDIVAKEQSDVRLALVEYRDHPPQDSTFVTRVNDFTAKVGEMKRWLTASQAHGGGDLPEAVADAMHDVLKLSWRPEATKICVLISDAPPHGLQAGGDSFPNGCPAGHDPMNIARQLAEKAITLYVVGCEPALTPYKDFFAALAYVTGGQYVPLSAASALTAVIVGGAQEELSLEQWMEQVNQQVLADVEARGEDNVDVEELSRNVMGRLKVAGARSKQLQVNNAVQAPSSGYVKNISACADMAAVRSEWKPAAPEMNMAMDFDAIGMSSPAPPEALCSVIPPPSRARNAMRSSPCPPPPPGAAMASMPMGRMGGGGMMNAMSFGGSPPAASYGTEEGEIHMAQAERMVQKALRRNNISLSKK